MSHDASAPPLAGGSSYTDWQRPSSGRVAPAANHGQRQTRMQKARNSQHGHRTPHKSLSLVPAAHRTYYPLGTIVISAGLVILLPTSGGPHRPLGLRAYELRLSATTTLIISGLRPLSPPPSSRPPKRRDPSTPPSDGSHFPIPKITEPAALTRSITVHTVQRLL